MKLLTLITLVAFTSPFCAHADTVYIVDGKIATKYEAMVALLNNKKAKVQKCEDQEITDKATMRKK